MPAPHTFLLRCYHTTCRRRKDLTGERYRKTIRGRDESPDEGKTVELSERNHNAHRAGASAEAARITAHADGVVGSSEGYSEVCSNLRGEENLADDSHSSRVRRGRGSINGARLKQVRHSRRSPVSIVGCATAGESAPAHPPSCRNIAAKHVLVPTPS